MSHVDAQLTPPARLRLARRVDPGTDEYLMRATTRAHVTAPASAASFSHRIKGLIDRPSSTKTTSTPAGAPSDQEVIVQRS